MMFNIDVYLCKCGKHFQVCKSLCILIRSSKWTDDFVDIEVKNFKVCPNCKTLYFLEQLELEKSTSTINLHNLESAQNPTCEDIKNYLENDQASQDRNLEYQLRKWYWWLSNHKRRQQNDNNEDLPYDIYELENIAKLAKLINLDNDWQLLMAAELMRNMRCFDLSLKILDKITDKNLLKSKLFMKKLCTKWDIYTREIKD